MGKPINWTDEMKQFIGDNYYGITTADLTDRLNEHFGTQINWTAVAGYKKRNNLSNGIDARFKKGHCPKNHRPVGSERINVDGYIEIKVAEPNVWKLKHRVVWEKVNGPIPENHALKFLDGNPLNCVVENLKLITRSELLIMSRYHLFSKDVEMNDAASNLARLIDQTNKAKKR